MATPKHRCFLALSPSGVPDRVRDAISAGVHQAGYQIVSAALGDDNIISHPLREILIGEMAHADCLLADISDLNPSIYYAIGAAQAMSKGVFLLADDSMLHAIPSNLLEFHVARYTQGKDELSGLTKRIVKLLTDFRRFPRRRPPSVRGTSSPPFFVDWDKLSTADTENLCKELFTQMGFKRIDWDMHSPEIDIIAELPKKDPDGFEYRELWLVSMGLRSPVDFLIELAHREPEYLLHRFGRYLDENRTRSLIQGNTPVTILLILPRKSGEMEEFDGYNDQLKKRSRRGALSSNVRLRIWDQTYLTSLIHQFPQIGYKYFSDEGRLRSQTRKSYEDLYNENSNMIERQAGLIIELEDEKSRRVSAERDAVWKDISFAAAHKIGNPIFAVETDLDPLLRRIKEKRTDEAIEVVDNIRSAVEKAKGFVEQFKSLAKAQQIKPEPILLKLVLDNSLRTICNQDIKYSLECEPQVAVMGDLDRLSECFDELIANSLHWFDKKEKKIGIKVTSPVSVSPPMLSPGRQYVLVHFTDNGVGVPIPQKGQIFDAFFTTHQHGTGLGLALVRRIIEGHGGAISEVGSPGNGADFEIYLPAAENVVSSNNSD